MYGIAYPFAVVSPEYRGKLNQYQGWYCPSFLRRAVIIIHGIGYSKQLSPDFLRGFQCGVIKYNE